jgi:tRNA pseudouridine55 synthase
MPPELNGIVVVDKPGGISSAGVVARVKDMFGARKVGHAGTLDPAATGVLICCLNQATRLSRFFLNGDKIYEAELTLGTVTDTQDATGAVLTRHPLGDLAEQHIREAAESFVGTIDQVPPVYSALKHRGTPLYKLARRGAAVEKPARSVRIYSLAVRAVRLPTVRFSVSCSSGTYIRTLCADMGRRLGCGGHLATLRRTASGGFSIGDAIGLDELALRAAQGRLAETVIAMNAALSFLPSMVVDTTLAKRIQNGGKLTAAELPGLPPPSDRGRFKVLSPHGRLIAVLDEPSPTGILNYCCVFSE